MKNTFLTMCLTALTAHCGYAGPNGKTGACSPPTSGMLGDSYQYCGSTGFAVSIGREITFEPVSPSDKDCWCGMSIEDSIDPTAGFKWTSGGGGEFDPADGIGETVKWTAPGNPSNSIHIALMLDDKAKATHTYDDGPFVEVASRDIQVYIPNKITWTTTSAPPNCSQGGVGQSVNLKDTVTNTGCSSLDFSGLEYTEDGPSVQTLTDGCNIGTPATGGPVATIGQNNLNSGVDWVRICSVPANPPDPLHPGTYGPFCRSEFTTDWRVRKTTGATIDRVWHVVATRKYKFMNDNLAYVEADQLTLSQSLAQ